MSPTHTTVYLIRHAATPANLTVPAKLQGCRSNPDLAPLGVRQAAATRDFLAVRPIEAVVSSPMRRAEQTARIVAEPHGVELEFLPDLTECDVGRWEGMSWEEIKAREPELYAKYHADPAAQGYAGGENFRQVYERAVRAMDEIMVRHEGGHVAVVTHHIVGRVYLAGVLGLGPSKGRMVSLDNAGVSVVRHKNGKTTVATFNSTFHLQGVGP